MKNSFLILTALAISASIMAGIGFSNASAPPYTLTNTVLNILPGSGGEGSISVNPTSQSNLQVAYYNSIAYSNNNGGTFTQHIGSGATYMDEDPYISVGANGTSYATDGACFPPNGPCQVSKSSDGGTTWTLATPYTGTSTVWSYQNGTTIAACSIPNYLIVDYAKLAVDSHPSSPFANYVYVLSGLRVGPNCDFTIGISRSTDGGNTWGLHRIIYLPAVQYLFLYEKLVVGGDGTLYFAAGSNDLYLVYSTDAGATWSYKKDPLNWTAHGMMSPVMAIAANSTIYFAVVTESVSGTTFQAFLIKTNDRGSTFTPPMLISDSSARLQAPDVGTQLNMISPTITVNPITLNVFVAWRDWRNAVNATQMDVYGYASLIGGSNFRLTPITGYCRTLNYSGANVTGATASCGGGNDYMDSASNNYSDFIFFGIDYNAYSNPTITQTLSIFTIPRISANPSSVTMACTGTNCPSLSSTITLTGYPVGTTATMTYGCLGPCTNNPYLTGPSSVSITGPTVSFTATINPASKVVAGTWTLTLTTADGSISLITQIQVQVTKH